MNHKANVNTEKSDKQANSAAVSTSLFAAIRQQLGDIESLVYSSQTLSEISYDQITLLSELTSGDKVNTAVMRLDALTRAVHRCTLLIQESAAVASLALEDAQGAAV